MSYLLYRRHLLAIVNRRLPTATNTGFKVNSQDNVASLKKLNENLAASTRSLQAKEVELSLANQRLEKLEEAKSKFVAVTTHQLRTPLAAIKWTLHMLTAGQLGAVTPEQKTFIDKAFESTERIVSIVNNLLTVDKIEAESSDYTFIPVHLEEVVESVIFELKAPAQSKYLNLIFKPLAQPLPEVTADPIKLRMVLENLIDNAIKYTPQHGTVTVTLDDSRLNATPASVVVKVQDTGLGIKPADEGKIFQKFFRAESAVAMEPDGTGLGLYLAKDIIEHHGGTIWFDSGSGGTTFTFTLPLRPVVV